MNPQIPDAQIRPTYIRAAVLTIHARHNPGSFARDILGLEEFDAVILQAFVEKFGSLEMAGNEAGRRLVKESSILSRAEDAENRELAEELCRLEEEMMRPTSEAFLNVLKHLSESARSRLTQYLDSITLEEPTDYFAEIETSREASLQRIRSWVFCVDNNDD